MTSNESQCDMILTRLKTGKSITPAIARAICGCDRLAARIYNLRKRFGDEQNADGSWNFIDRELVSVGMYYDKGKRHKKVAAYYWVPRVPTQG